MYEYDDNYLYYCHAEANKMFPESYHKIMPYVKRKCEMVDTENNPMMNPFPSKETVDKMVKEIHEEYKKDYGVNFEEDIEESYKLTRYNGYIGRDIIGILLLSQLLGRRGRRFRRRGFYGGYGGYPYYW